MPASNKALTGCATVELDVMERLNVNENPARELKSVAEMIVADGSFWQFWLSVIVAVAAKEMPRLSPLSKSST